MSYTDIEIAAIENIRKSASESTINNIKQTNALYPFMLANNLKLYENTPEEKDLVLHHLHQKFLTANSASDSTNSSGRNLLYFSVFYSEDYLDLLEGCLNSIFANTPDKGFNLLFITDEKFKAKIEKFPVLSEFEYDFLVLPPVDSAPAASIKKLYVYQYDKIDLYENILFLDADSLCIKNLNHIFSKQIDSGKLYISYTPIHLAPRLLSPTHGLMYLSFDDAAFLYENPNVIPFNAGQFFFKNSKRMKKHFENVIWLRNAWPSKFFYEQSLMNYYFVFKSLTAPLVDESGSQLVTVTYNPPKDDSEESIFAKILRASPRVKNIMTVSGASASSFSKEAILTIRLEHAILSDTSKLHTDSTVVIHFAATLPSGKSKKNFITNYINANQLHV